MIGWRIDWFDERFVKLLDRVKRLQAAGDTRGAKIVSCAGAAAAAAALEANDAAAGPTGSIDDNTGGDGAAGDGGSVGGGGSAAAAAAAAAADSGEIAADGPNRRGDTADVAGGLGPLANPTITNDVLKGISHVDRSSCCHLG